MNYDDFKAFTIKEVILDQGMSEDRFLRILNWALPDFARDLSLIDTTFYYEEDEQTNYTAGTQVDLGEILSFAGIVDEYNIAFPHAKRATKGYPLVSKYYEDPTSHHTIAWLEKVDNRPVDNISAIYFIYNRLPEKITTPTDSFTVIDCPRGAEFELALKMKYLYFLGREFYDEANQVRATYRTAMQDYWMKHRGNSMPPNTSIKQKYSRWNITPFR